MIISLKFISGVPLIEKKFEENDEYKQYQRETNCMFPWFHKDDSKVRITDRNAKNN